MKVTAILPDELIKKVRHFSHGHNITESLKIALNEWVSQQKVKALIYKIRNKPLKLNKGTYSKIREINRK